MGNRQRRASFWGVRAPASLKRRGRGGRRVVPVRFLGRSRPSLIEARNSPGPGAPARTTFLGRSRPSLIEAGFGELVEFGDALFLGRSRPSLIEALRWLRQSTLSPRPFWGVRAPASLKHVFPHPRRVEASAFWGVRAPASLKLRIVVRAGSVPRPFWGVRAPASLKRYNAATGGFR